MLAAVRPHTPAVRAVDVLAAHAAAPGAGVGRTPVVQHAADGLHSLGRMRN